MLSPEKEEPSAKVLSAMQLSGKGPGNLRRQQAVHELSSVPWQQRSPQQSSPQQPGSINRRIDGRSKEVIIPLLLGIH